MMAALVLRDYGDIVIQQVPRAQVGPNDVGIAVCLTGICGSDVHGYTAENSRRVPGQIMGTSPRATPPIEVRKPA